MKNILLSIITILSLENANAALPTKTSKPLNQKICDSLQTKIEDDCAHLVCDEGIENGDFKNLSECTNSSDYAEYAQGACDEQPTLEDLVSQYNKKHPTTKIKCD